MEAQSTPGFCPTPAMASPRSPRNDEPGPEVELRCSAPQGSDVGSKVGLLKLSYDVPGNRLNMVAEGVDRSSGGAELAVDASADDPANSDGKGKEREEQMLENRMTWELAVESGAVQYDEEDDIIAILQEQNEVLAQKKKLAKQKEKARRCRPKISKRCVKQF
ncbi:hypothetical protein AHAS_Ahas20G0047000 [Arachis hypogaea]